MVIKEKHYRRPQGVILQNEDVFYWNLLDVCLVNIFFHLTFTFDIYRSLLGIY